MQHFVSSILALIFHLTRESSLLVTEKGVYLSDTFLSENYFIKMCYCDQFSSSFFFSEFFFAMILRYQEVKMMLMTQKFLLKNKMITLQSLGQPRPILQALMTIYPRENGSVLDPMQHHLLIQTHPNCQRKSLGVVTCQASLRKRWRQARDCLETVSLI